ncbi:hypothetical protein ABPG74_011181 [Tetrahymena malaccensis]
MFPSSLNTKRRAACAAKGKNNTKASLSQQGEKIIEESQNNISHIESFLKKRSNLSAFSSYQCKPAVQAVNQKKCKKIFKDLPSIPKDSQFLIIDSDSEDSTSEEAYLQDSSSSSPSFVELKGLPAQINSKNQDTFLINGYQKIQNADRHSFILEATSSEGSTTASSEFKVEEESELIQESLQGYKKVKKESDSSFRYCPRKDSMLSTSSETQIWYGSNERSNNYFDDNYPCGSNQSSNLPTPNFTSCTPQTNKVYPNSSCQKIDNSCFLLDDAETNLPTRKNSVSDSYKSHENKESFQSSTNSPVKEEECIFRSNNLSGLKQKLLNLENLQHHHQLQHEQIKIDAELAASQAKEQEEKTQKMIKLIEQGRKLVEQRMGRLAAENQVINGFPCCTFTVRCFLKHTFVINVEDLLAGTWCNKCEENLLKAKEYAEENKGVCLSQFYGKTLKFKCSKNHCWESSQQTYRQRWCSQCKKIVKDQFKQYIKDEEAKKQAEYQKNQEEMYREARRKAMISQSCNEANPNSEDYKKKVILAAKQVEREVEKIAEQQARDYIKNEQKDSESPCNFSQLREMFKIILFPDQILQVYYTNLDAEILKSEYRNIARFIHPDKNSHPRAAESFQKLNNFYTLAQPKA